MDYVIYGVELLAILAIVFFVIGRDPQRPGDSDGGGD